MQPHSDPDIQPRGFWSLRVSTSALGIAAALLIVVAVSSYLQFQRALDARTWVQHTIEVLLRIESFRSRMLSAESSQRGYLITREQDFLRPYRAETTVINAELADLRTLTADNESQRDRVAELEPLVHHRLEMMAVVAAARPGAVPQSMLDQGRAVMLRIRDIIAAMELEENQLLDQRTAVAQRDTRNAALVIALGTVSLFVLLLVSIIQVNRGIRARDASLEERRKALNDLDQNAKELARSNADLQQFAYVASHDLQEPLRMVASFVQLLARRYRGRLDQSADEYIDYAVEGALRMQTLIQDLLEYSRLGSDGPRELHNADTREVLDQTLKNLRAAIHESGAVITHGEMPVLRTDPGQLGHVLQNLIANALKFRGPDPPRIHVAAAKRDGQWLFSVQDNGIGIDPAHKNKVFVIFQRLHGRGTYAGTGIGLSICKRIVNRLGGEIWVESEAGKGATFYFTLPGDAAAASTPR